MIVPTKQHEYMIWNDNMFVSTTFVLFLTWTVRFCCSSVISCCTFVINVQGRYFGNTNYCNIHVALLFDDTQGLWLYNNDNKDINVYVYWALDVLRCMADHWICVYCIAVVNTSVFKWNQSINLYIDHSNSSSCSQIYCTFYILCSITCDCVITWSGWRKGNVFDIERVQTHSEIIHIQ